MSRSEHFADVLVDVTTSLAGGVDLHGLLDRVTRHVAAMSGADLVGLVLADLDEAPRLVASTDDLVTTRELFGAEADQGPCADVLDLGEPVVDVDVAAAVQVWPVFAPAALRSGFRTVHGLPMRLRGQVIGAVVLLDRSARSLSSSDVDDLQALADLATIALVQDRSPARHEALVGRLGAALDDRVTVEQARGVLAQQHGVAMDEALRLLEVEAAAAGLAVVDVATGVLRGVGPWPRGRHLRAVGSVGRAGARDRPR